eukprot:COSAG04_NODE_9792_length_832_cov_0.799454_1_plen_180_part_10
MPPALAQGMDNYNRTDRAPVAEAAVPGGMLQLNLFVDGDRVETFFGGAATITTVVGNTAASGSQLSLRRVVASRGALVEPAGRTGALAEHDLRQHGAAGLHRRLVGAWALINFLQMCHGPPAPIRDDIGPTLLPAPHPNVEMATPESVWSSFDPAAGPLNEEVQRNWAEDAIIYKAAFFS